MISQVGCDSRVVGLQEAKRSLASEFSGRALNKRMQGVLLAHFRQYAIDHNVAKCKQGQPLKQLVPPKYIYSIAKYILHNDIPFAEKSLLMNLQKKKKIRGKKVLDTHKKKIKAFQKQNLKCLQSSSLKMLLKIVLNSLIFLIFLMLPFINSFN